MDDTGPGGRPPWDPARIRAERDERSKRIRAEAERERLALRAEEDRKKRAWIEAGNDLRQPPEYRGRVYDTADRDGVHPTSFPPMRDAAGGELTDEFIAFQAHNQLTYEKDPEHYCVECTIRFSARPGGRCGPCISRDPAYQQMLMFAPRRTRRKGGPEYPT